MPGSVSRAHLPESTVLRRIAGELTADERRNAESHLRKCANCRRALKTSERLDAVLRGVGPKLADLSPASQGLPEGDRFALRPAGAGPASVHVGLDSRALAQEAARSLPEARDLARQLVSAFPDEERRGTALNSLDLDDVRDRLALGYALDSLLDGVEEDPPLRRAEARAVLVWLDLKGVGRAASSTPAAAAEQAVSIASLRGRALLLSGAAALWSGDLDAARDGLLSAWRSFGEGRLSEPHLARVETFEALRRISEGHPAEAAALAGRAEETFAISGHEVDAARATLGAGLAAWGAGRHREGASLLRKSALGFRRAAAWSSFVTASCAAALCLAAHGQIEDSRRAFRDLRRRKAQEAPLADRMFVRETERIALLSERKPSKGKKTAAPFSAADAILLRGASVLGENLVASARKGDEELEISLSELQTIPYRAFVFLYACQKGNALVVQDPLRALKLGRSFLEEEESLRDAKSGGALAAAVLGETVMAEGELLKSASLVQLGYARESRRAAVDARELFLAGGDVRLGMALAEYYEGQAAGFERDYVAGEQLLKKALKIFADLGQDHFMGRAEAAIGTLLKQRGEEVRALPYLERGIEMLDPAEDSRPLSSTLNNLGGAVARLGRFDEAEVYFARALAAARRLNSEAHCHVIRNALAELELQRGRYGRALRAFLQLAGVARAAGWKMEQLFAELYVAECLGRLGREEEMAEAITVLRTEHRANPFTPSPAMGELFACLDQGILDSNLVAHVRAYLEDEAKGIRRPYLRLDVVG